MPRRRRHEESEDETLSEEQEWSFRRHLHSLGITGMEEYFLWCERHGFPRRAKKPSNQRRREFDLRMKERSDEAMAKLRKTSRSPGKMIDRIFAGEEDAAELTGPWESVAALVATLGKRQASKDAFRALLGHTHKRTKLFSDARVIPEYPASIHNSMLGALASLSTHSRAWIRPLETWKPSSKNASRQMADLSRHLLAEYPVPSFMDSVWFKRSRSQNWFLHIGQGQNIRTAERLLVPLTKKMAHEFSSAPSSYTVEHAFRWAQVHGIGGNERAVEAIRATRLGRHFANDSFWLSVVRFFVDNPMLDTVHYGPIVDYIHAQKFAAERLFVRPGEVRTLDPPHPGFSMSRRTPDTLLRQVTAWHRGLGKAEVAGDRAWNGCGIPPLRLVEGKERERVWTLDELLSSNALIEEGRAMSHCVGSYAASCAAGRTSVWTLRFHDGKAERRRLTVEVSPTRRNIVEARGRFNAYPTEQEMRVLRQWAEENDLTIPDYIAG